MDVLMIDDEQGGYHGQDRVDGSYNRFMDISYDESCRILGFETGRFACALLMEWMTL